jgi:hypothetical protein
MAGIWKLKFIFYLMETTHEPLHSYLQISFESLLSLMELLNMAVVWNFEVMLGQTWNYFVLNFLILWNVISL